MVRLFPRVLFEDALPPIALRSQVYSLVADRTVADRQLVRSVRATNGKALSCLAGTSEVLPITHSVHQLFSHSASAGSFWAGHCARHCGAEENATDPQGLACQMMKVEERSFWGN